MDKKPEMVTLKIDGREVTVPKGTNLIEAAKLAGVDVPYYCYHPNLSIAGNCRMCQVKVEGSPKLTIACNTTASEGMNVSTQHSSEDVAEAQRATLEFLLINHPLDCTVCDEAGQCKLQDYYYEYNAKPSRFQENKVHQIKAKRIGPEIMFDGERCIVCTRCVRFCEEVTKTGELGVFNRGDKAVIGIHAGKELDNPFDGSVVDLCPVGALTHKRWRFNTRIWNTKETDSVCPGCSTGCSAKVAVRDDQVVFVKARLNPAVNQEWMCNEGRYGFQRFQPDVRATSAFRNDGAESDIVPDAQAFQEAARLKGAGDDAAVFLSPFLTLEEQWVALQFAEKVMGIAADSDRIAVQYRSRQLSELEEILISPDYAPNVRALDLLGRQRSAEHWRKELEAAYRALLDKTRAGAFQRLLLVGDFAVHVDDLDTRLEDALHKASVSVVISPRGNSSNERGVHRSAQLVLPGRTVNEREGIFVNRDLRLQRLRRLLQPPFGSFPDWVLLSRVAQAAGQQLIDPAITDERALYRFVSGKIPGLENVSLMKIDPLGISYRADGVAVDNQLEAAAPAA